MEENRKSLWEQALPPAIGMILLMLWSGAAREAAAKAVKLSATVVFPALFPFGVLSRQLTSSGALRLRRGNRLCRRVFGVGTSGMGALLMGFCGGYPLGVDTACELYRTGQLGKEEAQRLITFCNNTGPGFFFGMIGAVVFQSAGVCAALFVIHILAAILTGLLLAVPDVRKRAPLSNQIRQTPETLSESLRRAFFSTAQLCGYVVFFSVVLAILLALPPVVWLMGRAFLPGDRISAIISAAVDLPNGIAAIARLGSPVERFFLCTAAIGWGGLCVHMQAAGLWQRAGLEPKGYYRGKLLHAAISAALAFPAARLLFGGAIPLWPGLVPMIVLAVKRTVAFSSNLRYNKKNTSKRRLRHALSAKNGTRLRLLRPGGKN